MPALFWGDGIADLGLSLYLLLADGYGWVSHGPACHAQYARIARPWLLVLLICYYLTDYSKSQRLKTTITYFLTVSMD